MVRFPKQKAPVKVMTMTGIKQRIGPAIRHYREEAGLSVSELARAVGVTEGAIRHYETGRQTPPIDKLESLGEALGVNPFLLLVQPGGQLSLVEKMVAAVEQLPEHDLVMLNALVERFLQGSTTS